MIHSLPQSLIDAASKVLNEALATKAQQTMADKASAKSKDSTGLTAAERISQHVIPLGHDRVVIPLQQNSTASAPESVKGHLEKHGYEVHNYSAGLAKEKGKKSASAQDVKDLANKHGMRRTDESEEEKELNIETPSKRKKYIVPAQDQAIKGNK